MRRSVDVSSMLSTDDLADYDIISEGHRSLESSIADLGHVESSAAIREPSPSRAARERFDTVGLSASEIQAHVQKAVPSAAVAWRTSEGEPRTVRVYVDGIFDPFQARDALQLRQAKLSFPVVHLMVGVFSDAICESHRTPIIWPLVERCEMLRHCRWVDEVLADAPWTIDEQFLRAKKIDYVAIDEGSSVNPACDKERLSGYDWVKSIRKAIPTKQTTVLTPIEPRGLSLFVEATRTVRGAPHRATVQSKDTGREGDVVPSPFEEPKLDDFGTGFSAI
ncbi:uncharacterized protein LAESUDRAFT_722245 [Laetiporus sulphureus 93-53]|uniref:choline-phosphate cytidylyltransferase n=1 Tax=Laetiporus sulphureus 93-53 TaxID=1314785 RepID=A0A165GAZ4_9APHY|nr:uncharacterized protein LAESUDRAFT_722245 [Laetiporus sulphureus 93-53]KZT10093.1 hypothetical protein LAESUDRAFT_722245 [Laetiporus sulphureus 93-53]